MRGFAFGVLDPGGERYRIAVKHSEQCPACRAYVLSLRGLAVVLPPAPMLLHWALAAGTGTGVGAAAGAGVTCSGSSLGGAGACAGAPAASGIGSGALSVSGAAGAGAAGGGWWLAGGLGAKLAVGCLLALGVSAGCVALDGGIRGATVSSRRHTREDGHAPSAHVAGPSARMAQVSTSRVEPRTTAAVAADQHSQPLTASARVSREFGPEHPAEDATVRHSGYVRPHAVSARRPTAHTATRALRTTLPTRTSAEASTGGSSAARREFSPG
jgi:hypothetical protein